MAYKRSVAQYFYRMCDGRHNLRLNFRGAEVCCGEPPLQILLPQLRQPSRFRVTRMNDHAIPEAQCAAWFERDTAVLRFVAGESAQAERIGGEQSIRAHMPARAARILRVIENCDPQLLTVDLAGVIHPIRGFP